MKNCPDCSKPLQFKEMTGIIYGFLPSCNTHTYECTNCEKSIVKLNWFLIIFYFLLGTALLILSFVAFRLKFLPIYLNLFNLMLGIGSYVIIIKGFLFKINSK